MTITMFSDIREDNMNQNHEIPIGAVVEITYEEYAYKAAECLQGLEFFVVNHTRDCDGVPLYELSSNPTAQKEYEDIERRKDELIQSGLYQLLHYQAKKGIWGPYLFDALRVISLPK